MGFSFGKRRLFAKATWALQLPLVSLLYAQPLKIMPLGDSITWGAGCSSAGTYRKFLSDSLLAHGIDFDFVGSKTCPNDLGYDTDNEGLSGSTTLNILKAGQDSSETETIYDWAPRYRPDIVLIHLGTNDVAQDFTADVTMENLAEIVRVLRSANPEIKVFIAEILPMAEKWDMRRRAIILNDSISALAWHLDLRPVDQFTGINPDEDLYDGTHPNETGYRKMAIRWFEAMYPQYATVKRPREGTAGIRDDRQGYEANGRLLDSAPPSSAKKEDPGLRFFK